ncbi:MAG: radical SAM protein [bacterium]|nr:radical SAM protein [bacterium]
MAKIVLINPPNVIQKGDLLGSGIVYMPHGMASLAAVLRESDLAPTVLDAFGEDPFRFYRFGDSWAQGLKVDRIIQMVGSDARIVLIYSASIHIHGMIRALIKGLKKEYPSTVIGVFENTQAVISYSLVHAAESFMECGVDFIMTGEPEVHAAEVLRSVLSHRQPGDIPGIITGNNSNAVIASSDHIEVDDLDNLPFLAWDLFPVSNYWNLRYAHGPAGGKYLALLTSRGCPFQCRFCSIPAMTSKRWRAQTPQRIVTEMHHWENSLDVSEFHWEDVNPGVDKGRVVKVSELLTERDFSYTWKWPSGTKIDKFETSDIQTLREGGLTYLSFSPESGSGELLKKMGKKFPHEKALELVTAMKIAGIRSQACFILGYPGETDKDRELTGSYISDLVGSGLDEVAIFIVTPMPGTPIDDQIPGERLLSQRTFSPTWRTDYRLLSKWRSRLYRTYFRTKAKKDPLEFMSMGLRTFTRRFETKAEMNLYRFVHMNLMKTLPFMRIHI